MDLYKVTADEVARAKVNPPDDVRVRLMDGTEVSAFVTGKNDRFASVWTRLHGSPVLIGEWTWAAIARTIKYGKVLKG